MRSRCWRSGWTAPKILIFRPARIRAAPLRSRRLGCELFPTRASASEPRFRNDSLYGKRDSPGETPTPDENAATFRAARRPPAVVNWRIFDFFLVCCDATTLLGPLQDGRFHSGKDNAVVRGARQAANVNMGNRKWRLSQTL